MTGGGFRVVSPGRSAHLNDMVAIEVPSARLSHDEVMPFVWQVPDFFGWQVSTSSRFCDLPYLAGAEPADVSGGIAGSGDRGATVLSSVGGSVIGVKSPVGK